MSLLSSRNHLFDRFSSKYPGFLVMDAIPEEDRSVASMEITIALMPQFPAQKYHEGPLYFLSKPQISEKEFHQRILHQK